jgi:2-keto-3-deoxy-L-rhamnonate aldolase RhmA
MKSASMFKRRLLDREPIFGLFCCSYSIQVVEALAGSGFDYMLFDGEHTPNSWPQLHAQLCALERSNTTSLVRVPSMDAAVIKLVLDMGVGGVMVPNVQSAQQAEQAVAMTRYPPHGLRGVAGTVRATNYGRDRAYLNQAQETFSLIIQVESTAGVNEAGRIADTPGVDAVFVGPNDLAADMGLLGQPDHPAVVQASLLAIQRVRDAGKAAGVLCPESAVPRYQQAGATVFALGSDLGLLVKEADAMSKRCQTGVSAATR